MAERQCPDCRCVIVREGEEHTGNRSPWNASLFCDHCLRERVQEGQRVPGGTYEDQGRTQTVFYVLCQKCGGSGVYLVSATQDGTDCWRCMGLGAMDAEKGSVQRWQRWSSTFQGNKVRSVKGTPE